MDIIWNVLWPVSAAALGFLIDLFAGDPPRLYHPVRLIGHWITACEKFLRKIFRKTKRGERAAGIVLVILVPAVSAGVPFAVLFLLYRFLPAAGFAVETFWCWQLLAARSLVKESDAVYLELKNGTIASSRRAVSRIVGRDTKHLDEAGVIRAAVETVAENTSDGVIAPLFYMMIGGAVTGFAYKAVNTMDSMVGYQNEEYRYFGTAAARLDDVLNFIPARLSALLMILSACLLKSAGSRGKKKAGNGAGDTVVSGTFQLYDGKNALRIWKRDRRCHASPNSAQTESVMAGALHIRLAGDAVYFGKLHKKPFLGDDDRPVEAEDIRRSHRLLWGTAVSGLLLLGLLRIGAALFLEVFI